jgi:hypothetical protein
MEEMAPVEDKNTVDAKEGTLAMSLKPVVTLEQMSVGGTFFSYPFLARI